MASVISHRGLWASRHERNTEPAFAASFRAGFGTETDVRDFCGSMTISHDPPLAGGVSLAEVLALRDAVDSTLPLALNVKSDGLQDLLLAALVDIDPRTYFLFDMAVADMVQTARAGLRFYTRMSDVEPVAVMLSQASGVWLDGFRDETWFDESLVEGLLREGKELCVVSPELHGRDPRRAWERWAGWSVTASERFVVCTDRPRDARAVMTG